MRKHCTRLNFRELALHAREVSHLLLRRRSIDYRKKGAPEERERVKLDRAHALVRLVDLFSRARRSFVNVDIYMSENR